MKNRARVRRPSLAAGAGTRFVRLKAAPPLPRPSASLIPLMAAGVIGAGGAGAAPPVIPAPNALPVPSSGARPFVYSGTVAGGQPSVTGSAMTVNQTSRTAGLNWSSFNIGANASVTFNQPDAGSRVLNRIGSADPSVIMGRLTANGQVYLINQNGILFGNGAQVNVGGLVASALNVSDELLQRGLPSAAGDKLRFDWSGDAASFANGFVTVEAGATITTPGGSPVVLLAPRTVENLGLIQSGAGAQAILAAGGAVMLTAPADPNLRGILVETQSFTGRDTLGASVTLDGTASNRAGGDIRAPVVSLAALAVNQEGTVNATQAINLNGTVMLVSGTNSSPRTTVNQRGRTAQIDWRNGFGVANGETVEFVQPAGGTAYNFINDPARAPGDSGRTVIDGTLAGNGQVVLVNEKGFDFTSRARVTAGNFIASALGINPDVVARDLFSLTNVSTPAFAFSLASQRANTEEDFAAASATGLSAFREAKIDVAAGATITTSENGFVMLAGSGVSQGGAISTPGGQTILAAGAKVYMKAPYSQVLRGFSPEVDPLTIVRAFESESPIPLSRGADANAIVNSGTVSAPFGNITLVGHEITQSGVLQTASSVTRNGSIRLLARDSTLQSFQRTVDTTSGQVIGTGAPLPSATTPEQFVIGTQGGTLTFAPGSSTRIDLDSSDGQTITAGQAFRRSTIEAGAARIDVQGAAGAQPGASLVARGGSINLTAYQSFGAESAFLSDRPVLPQTAAPFPDTQVFIGAGTTLDVSGAIASKSVADLFIPVELRGDELAGNPVQRSGVLRGQQAIVDLRDKVAIADLSGYFSKVGQSLEERAALGGDIALRSTGSVIVKPGALLDVSGGRVDYAAARVSESRVVDTRGNAFRLNDAKSDLGYTGIVTLARDERAYREGMSAGSVELTGNNLALGSTLRGNTVRGERQRTIGDPATDRTAVPRGGKLIVRDSGQHFDLAEDATAANLAQIAFLEGRATSADALGFGDAAGPRIDLSLPMLREGGFSRFDITSDGRIDVPAGATIALAPGGELFASGRQVFVGGDITAPGGTIQLRTRDMSLIAGFPAAAQSSALIVGAGALLSTAGVWVNDSLASAGEPAQRAINAGTVTLDSAYDVLLSARSTIDVSGGARVAPSGSLEAGTAGTIRVTSGRFGLVSALERQDSSVFLDGTLKAHALAGGGRLEINTSKVILGQSSTVDVRDAPRTERLGEDVRGAAFAADFTDQGGFYDFRFTGRDGVEVVDGARIAPQPWNWSLAAASGYRNVPTGTPIASFAGLARVPVLVRGAPTSVTLNTTSLEYGDLRIGEGAQVEVDPHGAIALDSKRQLTIFGSLTAPAGTITATRSASPIEGLEYSDARQSQSLFLGDAARLGVAGTVRLDESTRAYVAGGVAAATLLDRGLYRGQVLPGGTVRLDAGLGYLVTRPGSIIDVRGATGVLNVATAGAAGVMYRATPQASAGGKVLLGARDGMFLDGAYAASGAGGATGGTLSVRFGDPLYQQNPWLLPDGSPLQDVVNGPRVLTLLQSAGASTPQWPEPLSVPDYLTGSATLDPQTYNGRVRLDLAALTGSGFGSWYLQSQNRIALEGNIRASVPNQLRLDSPAFEGVAAADARFAAAAIQVGSFAPPVNQTVPELVTPGSASALFSARDLAIVGNSAWSGFATTRFQSSGGLHFDGQLSAAANRAGGRVFNGAMLGTGAVTFSASEIYPSTFSDFTVDLLADPASRIVLTRSADAFARPLLSVAGRIEMKANEIDHQGTLLAPLGEIVLAAPAVGGRVTLGPGSVTSVAADRAIPFGQTTLSGRRWIYEATFLSGGNVLTQQVEVAAPEKSVRLDAGTTRVAAGAVIDVSGGGEAFAYEFTPGPGGKSDVLAVSALQDPTTFAILPGWSGGFAPADSQSQRYYDVSGARRSGTGFVHDPIPALKPGDQIQLGANPFGLSAGESYTLLPARYALMPGAYLVTVKPGQALAAAGPLAQADGAASVQGSLLAANLDGSFTSYRSQPFTFEIASPATVAQRARYETTTGTQFFSQLPGAQLPGDAGRLSAVGRETLVFDPTVLGARMSEIAITGGGTRAGLGPQIDLAAPRIAIVDGNATAPDATWTALDKSTLNALQATSLLLGGVRSVQAGITAVEAISENVIVRTSRTSIEADALRGPEILLVATGTDALRSGVIVEGGSFIAATGAEAPARAFTIAGDGAFVRIAGGAQATLQRTGGVARVRGDVRLEEGATVSGRALVFDATRDNTLAGAILLRNAGAAPAAGGALAISANRINIVGDGSVPADGLTFTSASLAALGSPDQLRLTTYSTLDLYGNAQLGASTLKDLTVSAAGIAGHGDASTLAAISAESVRFENSNPETAAFIPGAAFGSGRLDVTAGTVLFGANATDAMRGSEQAGFAMRGFSRVDISARQDARFEGRGVVAINNDVEGVAPVSGPNAAFNVTAARVTAAAGSDQLVRASGASSIGGGSAGAAPQALGGKLEWRAGTLEVTGRIDATAGRLTLAATGDTALDPAVGHVTLASGARVAAEGARIAFADTSAFAPGGDILLQSRHGNVSIEAGATVSVSGEPGADAGRVTLSAREGTVTTAGALRGASSALTTLPRQGELVVDARSASADALVGAVSERLADGTARTHFTEAWNVRNRQGDLKLTGSVTARNVRFAADNGNVLVSGAIDASGPKGGVIELYARDGNVEVSGQLIARAQDVVLNTSNAGTRGEGGTVTLGATGTNARVVTAPGSVIDVSTAAGSAARGGAVLYRAPASGSIAAASDLNIQARGSVQGAATVSAEIVSAYSGTSLGNGAGFGDALGLGTIGADLAALYTPENVGTLRTHLGFADTAATRFIVRPGIDIATPAGLPADFAVVGDLNLGDLRYEAVGVALTVRAARDLQVFGTLSDGFVRAGVNAATSRDAALDVNGDSAGYRLVAGADAGAANPLATVARPAVGADFMTDPLGLGGTIEIAAGKLVRTGTGDIALAARRDIKLADTAAVYTAGRRDTTALADFAPSTLPTPSPGFVAVFTGGGGDVSLAAGETIGMYGAGDSAPQLNHINTWLFRGSAAGSSFRNTQWWTRLGSYRQGVAALGGGDIAIVAGADVKNISVAAPTNGRVPGLAGEPQRVADALILGGGDVAVSAGGSVIGGQFYAETGRLAIGAGEDVKGGEPRPGGTEPVDVGIALGNTDARVAARGAVTLGPVFNPLTVRRAYVRSDGVPYGSIPSNFANRLGTYSTSSALDVVAVGGDLTLRGGTAYLGLTDSAHALAPGKIKAAALSGDIVMAADLRLAPQAAGQLDLLAAGAVIASGPILQYDVPEGKLPSVATPLPEVVPALDSYRELAAFDRHASTPWHVADPEPSRIIALKGSITYSTAGLPLGDFAEAVRIEAARDVVNPWVVVQHNRAEDVSRVKAGGDVRFETTDFSRGGVLQVNGPARLEVIAGGSVDLGNSVGIVTRGNLENPNLPEQGASIRVLAGVTSGELYEPSVFDQLFLTLRTSGREAVSGGGEPSYEKGRAAVRALFTPASTASGNIDLFASQIKTEQGGSIDLLAPRGGITVGIANPSSDQQKEASQQGLFTIRGGDVRAFLSDSMLVNQSRVFTLDGGDILVWADRGSIDAGSGAKTVSAAPPPVLVIRNGAIVLDTSSSVSGSGIGTLASRPDTPASDLDLFAPQGAIDAGDAGLRTTGNVFLGAQQILNATNIQAAGAVVGAPVAVQAPAPVTAPTNPAANTQPGDAQAQQAAAAGRAGQQGILTVEVLGLGEDRARPEREDEECKEADKTKCDDKGRRG